MKYTILPLACLILLAFPCSAYRNFYQSDESNAKNELVLCNGILSLSQIKGISGESGAISYYMSFPSSMTGAACLTYRYYFKRKAAVGLCVGLDNQKGDISYGKDPSYAGFNPPSILSNAGVYKRNVYTIAPELLYAYYRSGHFMFYGYIGAGYSSVKVNYAFFPDVDHPERFFGPNGMVPSNPYTADFSNFTGQVTPLGFRWGNKVAFTLELGMGYKGLISMGLSGRI